MKSKNVTIGHNDVDWEGKLKVRLPDGVVSNLHENVELRFCSFNRVPEFVCSRLVRMMNGVIKAGAEFYSQAAPSLRDTPSI